MRKTPLNIVQDRLNFAIAQAWLEQFGMPPELLEKLSGYFEIPDDETMLEWLLLHFDCNDPHRKRWTDALTSAIEYLSDLFENRPLVEVLDDYRATKTEGSGRCAHLNLPHASSRSIQPALRLALCHWQRRLAFAVSATPSISLPLSR
jgi:hypothetical protein